MTTDRPAHEVEIEIEVTPEMIEAGKAAIFRYDADYANEEDIVLDIFDIVLKNLKQNTRI